MDKFAREYLDMKQDKREVIAHPNIPYFGTMICDQSPVPNVNARIGSIRMMTEYAFRQFKAIKKMI